MDICNNYLIYIQEMLKKMYNKERKVRLEDEWKKRKEKRNPEKQNTEISKAMLFNKVDFNRKEEERIRKQIISAR